MTLGSQGPGLGTWFLDLALDKFCPLQSTYCLQNGIFAFGFLWST